MQATNSRFVDNVAEAVDPIISTNLRLGTRSFEREPNNEGDQMTNHFLKTGVLIAVLVVLSAASGRAQGGSSFRVTVPFDFIVSDKTLPAGDYLVARSSQSSSEGLRIRAKDGRGGSYFQTKAIQIAESQKQTKVVFTRYGNQYFLSQVWISGRMTGRELHKSRKELTLEREVAGRAVKPETIAVTARAQ